MTKLVHKLSALAVILAFFLQPTVVAAQFLPEDDFDYESAAFGTEFTGEQLRELNQGFGGFGNNNMGNGLLGQALGDQVACQAEAPEAQQTTSAIGRGLAEGIVTSATESIKENLGKNVLADVKADLPQRLTNNIQNKLGPEFKRRMETLIENGLTAEQIDEAMVENVLRDSFEAVIKDSFMESVSESIPGAVSRSITEGMGTNLNENINTSLRYSMEGPFRNTLNSLLTGEGNVSENLIGGILDNMSSQIGNALMGQLQGSMDEIVSSITDGVMDSLEDSWNDITNDLTGSLDEIVGTLDGSLQDITDSLTNVVTQPLDAITGSLTDSIDDLTLDLQDSLGNITGKLDEMTDELTESITEPINRLTDKITGSIDKFTDKITNSIMEPVNKVVDKVSEVIPETINSAIEPLEEVADNIIQKPADMASQFTTGMISKVPGVGQFTGGLLSSSVPVHETGDLLEVTGNIEEIESESRDVLIEICGHIKDIRRIQLALEQKEFEGDAKARQEAADLVEEYRNQYLEFVKEGYVVDGSGEKDTLVVENYGDYYAERRAAAAKIVLDEYLKNSGDIFKEATREALTRQENESRYYPASTISREEYDKLKNPANMTSEELTTLLTKVYDPTKPNNPWTSYLINKDFLQQAKDRAEELAKDELQSSGFKPVRECVEVAEDGETCLKTRIITPGSIVENNVGKVFDSRVDQLEQADEVSDVGEETPAPAAEESERFETVDSQAGNSSNFDGGFARNIFSNLLSRLRGLFGNLGNNGGSGGGGGNNDDNNNNNGTSEGPEISFTFTTAEVEDILAGEANQAFLNWQSEEAINCTAGNDWLSAHNLNRRVTILANQGRNVGTEGTATLRYPLTFNLRLERERGGQTTIIPMATTTNPSLTQQVVAIALENADVAAGDTFRLIVRAGGGAEQYVTTTASGNNAGAVVTALKNTVDNLSASSAANQEFDRLRLTVGSNGSGTGFITATIDPVYQITCRNNTGITTESVTITRWNLTFLF